MLIRVVIGIVLLAVVCWTVDLKAVTMAFRRLDLGFLIAFCSVVVFDRILMAYKWNLLVRAQGILLSLWQATRLYYVGHLLGTFTPGAIGADAYRVAALTPFKKTPAVVSTVVLERVVGVAVIGVFAAATLPFSASYLGAHSTAVVVSVIAGSIVLVGGLLASLRPSIVEGIGRRAPYVTRSRITKKLVEVYRAYADNRSRPRLLAVFTVLTIVELILTIVMNYLAAHALGINVPFLYLVCVMPLLYILVRLPISFQGIGVHEGLLAYFLSAGGFSASDGLAIAVLLRMAEVGLGLLPAATRPCPSTA